MPFFDENMLPTELIKQISRRVARECAVIAFEADTNYDAEREILARFDCDPPSPVVNHQPTPVRHTKEIE